jgi:hypothetical protein
VEAWRRVLPRRYQMGQLNGAIRRDIRLLFAAKKLFSKGPFRESNCQKIGSACLLGAR